MVLFNLASYCSLAPRKSKDFLLTSIDILLCHDEALFGPSLKVLGSELISVDLVLGGEFLGLGSVPVPVVVAQRLKKKVEG